MNSPVPHGRKPMKQHMVEFFSPCVSVIVTGQSCSGKETEDRALLTTITGAPGFALDDYDEVLGKVSEAGYVLETFDACHSCGSIYACDCWEDDVCSHCLKEPCECSDFDAVPDMGAQG